MAKLFYNKAGIKSARAVILSVASLNNLPMPSSTALYSSIEEFYNVSKWDSERDIRSLDKVVNSCFEKMPFEIEVITESKLRSINNCLKDNGIVVIGHDIQTETKPTCNYFVVTKRNNNGVEVVNFWDGEGKFTKKQTIDDKQFRTSFRDGAAIWTLKKSL
jgi:16S rRNA G966 N2-methylase RsmD